MELLGEPGWQSDLSPRLPNSVSRGSAARSEHGAQTKHSQKSPGPKGLREGAAKPKRPDRVVFIPNFALGKQGKLTGPARRQRIPLRAGTRSRRSTEPSIRSTTPGCPEIPQNCSKQGGRFPPKPLINHSSPPNFSPHSPKPTTDPKHSPP